MNKTTYADICAAGIDRDDTRTPSPASPSPVADARFLLDWGNNLAGALRMILLGGHDEVRTARTEYLELMNRYINETVEHCERYYATTADILSARKRTPAPTSPTRSDTREQAAASPSAVAEVSESIRYVIADMNTCEKDRVPASLYSLGHWRRTLENALLSSQAPKPASAGGEPVACRWRRVGSDDTWQYAHPRAMLLDEPDWEFQALYIAAEADTAKTPLLGAPAWPGWPHSSPPADWKEISTPDRLAPIEARGVVTDAMLQAARNAWIAVEVPEGIDDDGEESFTVHLRHAILAALRARESAPAVEPSVATGCAEEELDAVGKFAITVEKLMCAKLGRNWAPSGMSIESLIDDLAALSQPTRAVKELPEAMSPSEIPLFRQNWDEK